MGIILGGGSKRISCVNYKVKGIPLFANKESIIGEVINLFMFINVVIGFTSVQHRALVVTQTLDFTDGMNRANSWKFLWKWKPLVVISSVSVDEKYLFSYILDDINVRLPSSLVKQGPVDTGKWVFSNKGGHVEQYMAHLGEDLCPHVTP